MLNKHSIACPLCFSESVEEFYRQGDIPVHVNIIYNTCEEAVNCGKGAISLTLCHNCGLVFNSEFSDRLLEYDKNYDNEQYYSSWYEEYADNLAKILIDRYHIGSKRILEVGCGNGNFLRLLCMQSHSKGVGIDPAYRGKKETGDVSFITDYFNEKYSGIEADVLILRHVLEHIQNPGEFLTHIVHNIAVDTELVAMIEAPDFKWILEQGAYWDILYEHCNYFTKESLENLLQLSQIEVSDIFSTFQNQYAMAIGKFAMKKPSEPKLVGQPCSSREIIDAFVSNVEERRHRIDSIIDGREGPFTIWGVAGKGVTFINMLDTRVQGEIPFVIDINEKKQGKYCPGTGHKIVPPALLEQEKGLKDIMVMNPNYYAEIARLVEGYGREFNLITI